MGRFGAYGVSLAAEGIIRLLPCIPLALAGVTNPFWYGLCLAVPPLLATGVAMYGQQRSRDAGPAAPWSELSTNLGYLLGGSMLAQVLSYAPFIGAQVLAKPEPARRGRRLHRSASSSPASRSCCSRPCRPRCCPKLSTLVSAGRDDEFQNGVRKLVLIVRRHRRARRDRRRNDRAVRGPHPVRRTSSTSATPTSRCSRLGSGLFILALMLSQALIALSGHRQAMVAWFVGIVAFVATLAVDHPRAVPAGRARLDRRRRCQRAAAMGWFFLRRLSKGVEAGSLASLVEQIEYGPLEI